MKIYKGFLFILSVMALLAVLALVFPQPSCRVGGVELRFPTIASVLEPSARTQRTADDMISDVERTLHIEPVVDSTRLAYLDSLSFYTSFFSSNPSRIHCPQGDSTFLFPLFDALDSLDGGLLHIAHYGDSQIEGDRITCTLRSRFQQRFGGSGPGILPLFQPIGAYSVAQTLTDSVASYYAGGIMGERASHNRYGAICQMSSLTDDTVQITISARRTRNFKRVTLYAGRIDSALTVRVNGKSSGLAKGEPVRKLEWKFNSANKINMKLSGTAEIYGIAIDGGSGVSVTNVPMRGSDGTYFTRIAKAEMKYMHEHLNTRLVILEFGGNAMPWIKDSVGVSYYCSNLKRQIDYIKDVCPKAQVLVIGPADMSKKVHGVLQTYPLLPYLVERMRAASLEKGAAYWDMYQVMGGYNSMIAWVDNKPSLAAPDYIHFTRRGADRISDLLWRSIMIYYDYRSFISRKEEPCAE